MTAGDNSVFRASLIAAGILFVLFVISLVLSFFLWRWGDTQMQRAESVQNRLTMTQNELRKQVDQAQLMKAMLGLGAMTKAEWDALPQRANSDQDIDAISQTFLRDMALFAPEVESQNRNYPALATYLNAAILDCQSRHDAAREAALEAEGKVDSQSQDAASEAPNDSPK